MSILEPRSYSMSPDLGPIDDEQAALRARIDAMGGPMMQNKGYIHKALGLEPDADPISTEVAEAGR